MKDCKTCSHITPCRSYSKNHDLDFICQSYEPKRVKCENGCVKKIIYNEFGDFEKAKYCHKCGTEIKHE